MDFVKAYNSSTGKSTSDQNASHFSKFHAFYYWYF